MLARGISRGITSLHNLGISALPGDRRGTFVQLEKLDKRSRLLLIRGSVFKSLAAHRMTWGLYVPGHFYLLRARSRMPDTGGDAGGDDL